MSSPEAKAVYRTKRWTRTSKAARERDEYHCRWCGGMANTAHHWPPIETLLSQGISPYDLDYIYTACAHCHGCEDGARAHAPKPAKVNRFKSWLDDPGQ